MTAAHLEACAACRAHLDWLRTERDLFAARARADHAPLPDFEGVLARMPGAAVVPMAPARERARRFVVDGRAFALSLCAAAALLCVALPQRAPEPPMAVPEPRPAPVAVAAGTAYDVGSEEACAVQSCCGEDSACGEPEGDAAQSAAASMPTSPEASLCSDGACRSPAEYGSTARAALVEERIDLTCSEDL